MDMQISDYTVVMMMVQDVVLLVYMGSWCVIEGRVPGNIRMVTCKLGGKALVGATQT